MWSQVPTFIQDEQGRIVVNPKKQFIQPFELGIDDPNHVVALTAGQRRGPFPMTAQADGPIELFYVKVLVKDAQASPLTTYDIDWFLDHPGKRKSFMNQDIPLLATAGDAGRPYVLPETIFIPAIQSLNVTLENRDVAGRQVELLFGGVKYYPNSAPEKIRDEMWSYIARRERTYLYFQTTDEEVVLTAAQVGAQAFATIPDDADLEIFKLTAQSTGRFACKIKDSMNDRGLMAQKWDGSLLFGGHVITALGGGIGGSGGVYPARWPTTYLCRRSVKMNLEFDDRSGAPNTVRVVMAGRKIAYA